MAEIVWFGEDGGRAGSIGAVCATVSAGTVARARVAIAPARLFGEVVALSGGALPVVVIEPAAVRRVRLPDAGAADVVPATISAAELAARLRAVGRREVGRRTVVGDVAIDPATRRVSRGGRPVAIDPRGYAVLACLARRRGQPVSRAELYEEVWLRRFDPGTNVVAVTVSRLRAAIGHDAIATVPGGYRLGAAADGG